MKVQEARTYKAKRLEDAKKGKKIAIEYMASAKTLLGENDNADASDYRIIFLEKDAISPKKASLTDNRGNAHSTQLESILNSQSIFNAICIFSPDGNEDEINEIIAKFYESKGVKYSGRQEFAFKMVPVEKVEETDEKPNTKKRGKKSKVEETDEKPKTNSEQLDDLVENLS